MASIVLHQGIDLASLPVAEVHQVIDRSDLAEQLAEVRRSWEAANPDQPLSEVMASVGLLLVDMADLLQLDHAQRVEALGLDLAGL